MDSLEKEIVPYDVALRLKIIGYNTLKRESCFAYYNTSNSLHDLESADWWSLPKNDFQYALSAPTFSQAFRWFRNKYNLRGFIGFRPNVKKFDHHIYDMSLSGREYVKQRTMEEFNKDPLVGTYEEAELACLIKLIEIVESKTE